MKTTVKKKKTREKAAKKREQKQEEKREKKTVQKSHVESVTDKVGEIAVQYGFTVIKAPPVGGPETIRGKQFKEFDYYGDAEEKIALTNWYINDKLDSGAQPLLIHYKKQFAPTALRKKSTQEMYGFEIMGSNRSTSEALLLKCALAVLDELGYKDTYIDINTIGDRESIAKFERELGNYHRKHVGAMPAKLRQEFKKNHYAILTNTSAENDELRNSAPQPIGSLSEIARIHFKEVLEFLETFEVTYKIKPSVLSNKLYASHTAFEIRSGDDLLAYGYRYNHLAKKLGGKREVPSIGATIVVKKTPAVNKKVLIKSIKKPRFYLIQLGPSAKLKALNVVEMLRKHKIPVYHSITKDKITGQLSGAEYMKATHVLVMGQKEAMENSIIVRSIATREQETVFLANLPEFLKGLDKKK
jgi:histidyl-tRNA synthetase